MSCQRIDPHYQFTLSATATTAAVAAFSGIDIDDRLLPFYTSRVGSYARCGVLAVSQAVAGDLKVRIYGAAHRILLNGKDLCDMTHENFETDYLPFLSGFELQDMRVNMSAIGSAFEPSFGGVDQPRPLGDSEGALCAFPHLVFLVAGTPPAANAEDVSGEFTVCWSR